MALRSASTASVSPSITMSREKNSASPSSSPLTMEISFGSGPRTAASQTTASSRRCGVRSGRSASGRMMKTTGRSTGSMRNRRRPYSPSRSNISGCLRSIPAISC